MKAGKHQSNHGFTSPAPSLRPVEIRKEAIMKPAIATLFLVPIFASPCLAQEPQPKPEPKATETAATEPLPTIDQIVDKLIEAEGGRAALEKISSRQLSGTFEIPAMSASGTIKGFAKAPNKMLMIIDVPGFGVIQSGFDGTAAWAQDPMGGMRDITGAELASTKRDAEFHQSLRLKETFKTLTVKGKEMVGEKTAYLVEATPPEGKVEKMYFDAVTGLLLRHDAERESPQGVAKVESYFDDYKDVDGVKVPFTLKRVLPAFALTVKFDEIKNNVEIDNAKFAKPAAQ